MLLKTQKIDFTIELPFISYFVQRSLNMQNNIKIEPLLESNTFVEAYIACSLNDAGSAAINAINKVIKKHRTTESYQVIFENWIPPASLPSYREGFERIVVQGL